MYLTEAVAQCALVQDTIIFRVAFLMGLKLDLFNNCNQLRAPQHVNPVFWVCFAVIGLTVLQTGLVESSTAKTRQRRIGRQPTAPHPPISSVSWPCNSACLSPE